MGMARGRPIMLVGYAGSIKSWLAQDMALSVAAGLPTMWGGVPVELSGPVRFFDYENIGETSARRLQRLAAGRGIDLESLGTNIGRVALPDVYLTSPGAEDEFAAACEGVSLAVIDSLRAACPGVEENDSRVREHLDRLNRATQRTGTVFVLIHHERKPQDGKGARGVYGVRGSSALVDAVDCTIGVGPVGGGVYRIEAGKVSTSREVSPLRVRLLDEGDVDPMSGLSRAVRIATADDQADGGGQSSPKATDAVRDCIRAQPGIAGAEAVRAAVRLAMKPVRDAIDHLIETGEVVGRAGESGRGRRLYHKDHAPIPD